MHGGWGGPFSLAHDIQGCNYSKGGYDEYHAAHPEQTDGAQILADLRRVNVQGLPDSRAGDRLNGLVGGPFRQESVIPH